jgi:tetratricopeptide (TPR) repeat protein
MKELVYATSLSTILYSSKPLSQQAPIISLSIEEAEAKFKFKYTESLWGDREKLKAYINNPILQQQIMKQKDLPNLQAVLARLESPLKSLIICDMGSPVGHGLFALEDIAANTILFLYSGKVTHGKIFEEGDDYSAQWTKGEDVACLPTKYISAKNLGGLARFMQHLPLDKARHSAYLKQGLEKEIKNRYGEQQAAELLAAKNISLDEVVSELMAPTSSELEDIKFKDSVKAQLATTNMTVACIVINNIPVSVCWTPYGIKKGEPIGFNYGPHYWANANKKPKYFTQAGLIIPAADYSYKIDPLPLSSKPTLYSHRAPLSLYQEGIQAYKEKNYLQAENILKNALGLYKQTKGKETAEYGLCYSALASCYRELSNIDMAIYYCEKALLILSKHGNKKQLENSQKKYREILSKKPGKELYGRAVLLYKQKEYAMALYPLLLATDYFEKLEKLPEKASYYSTLASCYREVGELEKAKNEVEKALRVRRKAHGDFHPLVEKDREKLAQLDTLFKNKQMEGKRASVGI